MRRAVFRELHLIAEMSYALYSVDCSNQAVCDSVTLTWRRLVNEIEAWNVYIGYAVHPLLAIHFTAICVNGARAFPDFQEPVSQIVQDWCLSGII